MRQLSKGNKLNTEKVKPVSAGQSKEEFNRKIKEPEYVKDLRERCVKAYIVAEKNRTACDDTIRNEYETKTILFGYIAVNNFTLTWFLIENSFSFFQIPNFSFLDAPFLWLLSFSL